MAAVRESIARVTDVAAGASLAGPEGGVWRTAGRVRGRGPVGESDGWDYSTEGDLDPDLAEEEAYSSWDPRPRRIWRLAYQVLLAAGLVVLLVPLVLTALR